MQAMKILHSADWHLGAYVGPQCDDPMKRMENTMKCLDVLVETAEREQPDIIVIPGDILHQAKVWAERAMTEVQVASKYLNKLGAIATTIVLAGTPNHDGLEQLKTINFMTDVSVKFIFEPELLHMITKSGPIQIAGLPGFDKGHFRAQFPGLSAEEENQVFTQQLSLIVQGLSAQVDPTIPSVLMAHHTVVGCELDNGTHVFQANEVVLDAATLDNSAFDLVCLGHIHKAQRVEACNKPMYYAGSVDAFTFNDEGHEKGFYLHDTEWPVNGHMLIKTPAREFVTRRMNAEDITTITNGYLVPNDTNKDKVVRVLYTCDSETEKALDKKKLERDLYAAGAYYVSEIRPEKVTAAVNKNSFHEKMTVESCLQRYLEEKKKTPEEIAQLIEMAADIIAQAQASSPAGTTSGLFTPVEIQVHNYRSFKDETFSFLDIFFAMVNGANGSGKSSLFMDAPCDAVFEQTREGELTGWIRNGEKSGSISFTFKLGDDTWRVTRTRQRSGKATLALAKKYDERPDFIPENLNANENWQDHSCERMVDTQEKIKQLLGMDCDTFQSCVLIMQDRYGKFMEASKEDRMNVLASLLGLGIYDELEKLAKDKLTEVNRAIKLLKADIEKLEGDVSTEEGLRMEGAQVEIQLSVANDDLKTAREELTGYQAQLISIDGFVREISELEKDVKSKTDAYTEKKNRKADLENRVFETESFLKGEQNILDRCAELESIKMEIAGMDGKLKMLEDKRLQCGKANRELVAAQGQRKSIADRLTAIKMNLQDKERLEAIVTSSTVEADLEQHEFKAKQYNEADNKALRLQMEKNETERSGKSELREMEQRIGMLKGKTIMLKDASCIDIEKASCRFLKDAISAKAELEKLEVDWDGKSKSFTVAVEEASKKFQDALSFRNSIGYNAMAHDAIIQRVKEYHAAKDMLSKMSADSATADALVGQDADLILKITNCEQELKLLSGEIAALELETSKHSELVAKVKSLLQYENLKMQLLKAKQFVESSREQIGQLTVDLAGLQESIEKGNNRLTELHDLTSNRNAIFSTIRFIESEIKAKEKFVSEYNQQIGTINAKLEVIVGQKVQLTAKQAELSTSAKQAAQLQVLVEAFSQDGIPYQIIRDIVPDLEAAANEILGQMTGGKMRLEFVTEKVLKSNKAKEVATLEIIINSVEHGALPYMSHSGGEKVRSALAVNFALANIKASRVGLQLGMMFVDEPPFLDADGAEAYCCVLEIQHDKYPTMRILAISHDQNMKTLFPQQLYVDVTENGSRVRRL
jgi:exonuclease SbcC